MTARCFCGLFAGVMLIGGALVLPAQDTVTIPKSRLEELERKEAELKRLQGDATNNRHLTSQPAMPAPTVAPAPAQPRPAPLPDFKPGDLIDAADLANAFRSDPTRAEQLYRKKPMAVRGEIVRFHKRLLSRDYTVILKLPTRLLRSLVM